MKKQKKPQSNGRRSQFNIQASGLSEKAYLYVEALSSKKELSQKFWEWAEREVNGDYPQATSTTDVAHSQLESQVQQLSLQLQMVMGQIGQIGQMPQQMPQQGMTHMGYPPVAYQQQQPVPYPYNQGQAVQPPQQSQQNYNQQGYGQQAFGQPQPPYSQQQAQHQPFMQQQNQPFMQTQQQGQQPSFIPTQQQTQTEFPQGNQSSFETVNQHSPNTGGNKSTKKKVPPTLMSNVSNEVVQSDIDEDTDYDY